jgi:hypothetical protein
MSIAMMVFCPNCKRIKSSAGWVEPTSGKDKLVAMLRGQGTTVHEIPQKCPGCSTQAITAPVKKRN